MARIDEWIAMYERYMQVAENEGNPDRNRLEECHMAAEALLKGILTARGEDFEQTHNTIQLADKIPRLPKEKRSTLKTLFRVYGNRYPQGYDYTNVPVEKHVENIKELKGWADDTQFD